MKQLLIILSTIMCANCFAQTKTEEDIIKRFKNDPLTKVETLSPPDTLVLSTMLLTREKLGYVRRITTFPKNQNIAYYEYYYNNTTTLNATMTYDTLGKPIGLHKEYDVTGKLLSTVDWDNGAWTITDTARFPNYMLQQKMKEKGDSLITVMYSSGFLQHHTVWEPTGSYFEADSNSYNWTDSAKSKPKSFLLRYGVKLDKDHLYYEMIEFQLDSTGNLIPEEEEFIYGFEHLTENESHEFKLTYNSAYALARENGLVETDSIKTKGELKWDKFQKHFFFQIRQPYKAEKVDVKSKYQFNIITYYNVWCFNPWTGYMTEQKQQKGIDHFVQGCGWGSIEDIKK